MLIGVGTTVEVVGKVIGSFEKVEHFFLDTLGVGTVISVHTALLVLTGTLLVAGYCVITFWIYSKYHNRPWSTRLAIGIPSATTLTLLAWMNYLLIPPPPDVNKYLNTERKEWAARPLAATADPGENKIDVGGIPVSSLETRSPAQVWTTAQSLRGILGSGQVLDTSAVDRIKNAFAYIERVRQPGRSGGFGYFDDWPWGVTEISAWVGLADVAALRRKDLWKDEEVQHLRERLAGELETVEAARQDDGGMAPTTALKGPQTSRTYSTVLSLWLIIDAMDLDNVPGISEAEFQSRARQTALWLLNHYSSQMRAGTAELAWVPNPFRQNQDEYFLGLDAQVLYVLSHAVSHAGLTDLAQHQNYLAAASSFLRYPDFQVRSVDKNDRLHDNDRYINGTRTDAGTPRCSCPITIEASTFLWYPWSVAAAEALAQSSTLDADTKKRASQIAEQLIDRLTEKDIVPWVQRQMNYIVAEFLICVTPRDIR